MQSKAAMLAVLIALLATLGPQPTAGWTTAQASWYDGIWAGFCQFFDNIPQNQFVAAWPKIETGPPGTGQEYWQPGFSGDACGQCVEIRCVPGFVENSLGNIYIDRTGDCRDKDMGIVVKVVDECRCSGADRQLSDRGNFNWCCNIATPKLKIDRHIDMSKAAFTQLIRGGDYGLGLMQIAYRPASCDYIGLTRINSDGSSSPLNGGSQVNGPSSPSYQQGSSGSSSDGGSSDQAAPLPAPPSPPSNPPSDSGSSSSSSQSSGSPPSSESSSPSSPESSPTSDSSSSSTTSSDSSSSSSDSSSTSESSPTSPSTNSTSDNSTTNSTIPNGTVPESGSFEAPAMDLPAPGDIGRTESVSTGELAVTLAHYSQCGGNGGNCRNAGGESACGDMPFAGYTCENNLMCVRQNRWFWQCLSQSEMDQIRSSRNPAWQTEVPEKAAGCNKLLYISEQCGGIGGSCQDVTCADRQVTGTCCEPGSYCKRFDAWYWECRPDGA